jgi:hypothetical protein
MQAYRAALLSFADDGSARYEETACWSSGPIAGPQGGASRRVPTASLHANYPGVAIEHLPARSSGPASSTCTSTFRRPT